MSVLIADDAIEDRTLVEVGCMHKGNEQVAAMMTDESARSASISSGGAGSSERALLNREQAGRKGGGSAEAILATGAFPNIR